jgi:hypothetical protein
MKKIIAALFIFSLLFVSDICTRQADAAYAQPYYGDPNVSRRDTPGYAESSYYFQVSYSATQGNYGANNYGQASYSNNSSQYVQGVYGSNFAQTGCAQGGIAQANCVQYQQPGYGGGYTQSTYGGGTPVPTNPASQPGLGLQLIPLTPQWQISGSVFSDRNGNRIKDSGEAGYTGAPSITVQGRSTTNNTITLSRSNNAA